MKFTTKTEYGLVCLVYMVRHGSLNPVTVTDIVRDEQYPSAYIEKILQSLRVAGIVSSRQGSQGGYTLTRTPEMITLKEIVSALEGGLFDVFCEPEVRKNITCTHHELCGLKPVWHLTQKTLSRLYEQVTLKMIAENQLEMFDVRLEKNQQPETNPRGLGPLTAEVEAGKSYDK